MPAMIDALRAEHKTMAKILKVIEGELKTFEAGDAPDYDLILMALDYLQDFPEQVHHPKEDLVYAHLERARADMAKEMTGLAAEHQDIATKVQAFRQAVDRVLEEEEISRDVDRGGDPLRPGRHAAWRRATGRISCWKRPIAPTQFLRVRRLIT